MSSRRSRAAGLVLACAALMAAVSGAGAAKYTVGGDNGWAVPAAGAESYNTWAEKTGFQTGDQLREQNLHFTHFIFTQFHFRLD